MSVRTFLVEIGFVTLGWGLRLPSSRNVADFEQWGQLIDLVRKLDINVFLDVGANKGQFSKHLRRSGYRRRLISFEPIPEDSQRIRNLAKGDPEWIVCDYALGSECCEREFKINVTGETNTVFSSFLPVRNVECNSQKILTKIRRLHDVLPNLIGDIRGPRIFLKMDTQGFDRNVFDGVGNWMDRVVGLQSELSVVHLYDNVPHFTGTIEHYEGRGFELMNLFVVSRSGDGRVIEYDCVMAKTGVGAGQPVR